MSEAKLEALRAWGEEQISRAIWPPAEHGDVVTLMMTAEGDRVRDALVAFAERFADEGHTADTYGPWVGVEKKGAPMGMFPPGAELMECQGARGILRVMRWQRKGPFLCLAVSHFGGSVATLPDRYPTLAEIDKALQMWPKDIPAGIPLNRDPGSPVIEIWQTGPATAPESKSGIIVVGG